MSNVKSDTVILSKLETIVVFVDYISNSSKFIIMTETTEKVENCSEARRRILNIAVSTVLLETGFDAADKMSLETLTEIMQCCK